MEQFKEIFQVLVVRRFQQIYQLSAEFAPKLFLALIILLIGWVLAILTKKIIAKLLRALGVDIVFEKTGGKQFLEKGGLAKRPSLLIGFIFYWIIFFSALLMAFNTLELEVVAQFVRKVLQYMPSVIMSLILFGLGIFLSNFVSRFVETACRLARLPFAVFFGKVSQYVVIGLALTLVLEYLTPKEAIAIESLVVIFAVIPAVIALVILIGARGILSDIISGRFLSAEYKKGEAVEFDDVSGKVEAVDLTTTKIRSGENQVIIPNSELAKKVIRKLKEEVV